MEPVDDVDARLRHAARADTEAVDRVTRAALETRPARRLITWAIPLAAALLVIVAAALWRPGPTTPATVVEVTVESGGDAVTLRAPDGTTWLFAGRGAPDFPAGTCLVIAGGTR